MCKSYTFALAGNQNSGKTTLFNRLTGSNQHVGNWPGVTVEQKTGSLTEPFRGEVRSEVKFVDLPGIYSLSPFSMEEVITRSFLTQEHPDVIINIVDATNLERSLYLTLQLRQLGTPMVIALNMMDEVRARGDVIRPDVLARELGVPVLAICARSGEGLDALVRLSVSLAAKGKALPPLELGSGAVQTTLRTIARLIAPQAQAHGLSASYAAVKLFEGDPPLQALLSLRPEELRRLDDLLADVEHTQGMERTAIMANFRYAYIEKLLAQAVFQKHDPSQTVTLPERIDRVLLHPVLAIPLFLCAMLLVFWITFGPIGSRIADSFSSLVDAGIGAISAALTATQVVPWLRELVVDGILTGVGSVLSFLPTIVMLFMCLSVLEDSGYMARAAFLMEKPLRRLGLNGRSFIPMMMGFGCTVPAVMSARSMSSQRDRRFTILLTPFMSCGAKVPVYALFARAFFGGNQVLVMTVLYLTGILIAIGAGLLCKRAVFRGDAAPFLMELPSYRLPTPRSVLRQLRDKASDFLQRAFTVIFLATMLVWLLERFTFRFTVASTLAESMLGTLAGWIAPLFAPCGFGSRAASAAILTGVMAKESVVSTLVLLTGADVQGTALTTALQGVFPSQLAAASFLVFVLLYMPCIAAFAAMRRELESRRWAIFAVLGQTVLAWIAAALVYQLGHLLGLG